MKNALVAIALIAAASSAPVQRAKGTIGGGDLDVNSRAAFRVEARARTEETVVTGTSTGRTGIQSSSLSARSRAAR